MFTRQEAIDTLVNDFGLEASKVKKMSTRDIQRKLDTLKSQVTTAQANAAPAQTVIDVTDGAATQPQTPAADSQTKAPKQPKQPKQRRVAEEDPFVLGFKVTVPATGETKIFALKYGFQDFGGKPYCQMIVDDVKMNSSDKFFVRTYNTEKTAQEHIAKFTTVRQEDTENFLNRRDPDGYLGLQAIRISEIKALSA